MKHADLMNNTDRAELEQAEKLSKEGRSIRKRVLTRLRARAFRSKGK